MTRKCPLMRIGAIVEGGAKYFSSVSKASSTTCLGDDCEWFVNGECAVRTIVQSCSAERKAVKR